jgi:MFS family permease
VPAGPVGRATRVGLGGDRLALLAVCVLGVAHASIYTNHAPLIPILGAELGFGAAEAGLLSSAFFASSAAIMLPAGLLGDRIGPKRVALVGLLVLGAATMALWWARGLADLLLLKAAAGIGAGATFVSGTRYTSTRFAGGTAQVALGLYGGAIQLGTGLAVSLKPVAAGALGWRGGFVVSGAICWLAALLWAGTPPVGAGRAPLP